MIGWNPRAPQAWADLLGMVAVPLFRPQSRNPVTGTHAILQDGERAQLFAFNRHTG